MTWKKWLACAAAPLAIGCGGGNQQALSSGSTGAFGIVTVDGKQKLYLPEPTGNGATGNGEIAVVDVGVGGNGTSGAKALITRIDLGTADLATATGGDSSVVVAASKSSPVVWLIDPHADKVTKTIQLPTSYGYSSFSGGGGYVTGIAMDSAHHRAILSVWNGFALLDTGSGEITQVIEAPPSENFGFDSVHQRIIAPFYDCGASYGGDGNPPAFCGSYTDTSGAEMSEGVNVIDLAKGAVYTYQDPGYTNASTGASANAPVDGEPDGAAVNPNTGVVVVASESANTQHVISLQDGSFDDGHKWVTASQQVVEDKYASLTGVSIEPAKNLAFFEEEWGRSVGVLKLDDAVNGHGQVVVGTLPDLPDGTTWANMGDPHGIAVTTGLNDGKSVGFVVTGDGTWVARIDLEKFAGFDGSAAPVDQPTMASAVTYLQVQ